MKDIQMKELQRMIKFISGAGCKFKIITPDGEEFGELEVKPMGSKTRGPLERPYGELINFYKPQIKLDAPVGSVQEISSGEYPPLRIQSGVCSLLHREWGKDNYTTCINNKTKSIEILRIAEKGE
jgi:hypothetical protein